MDLSQIQTFRASLRELVRELGMLSRKSSGTGLSPLQSHILIELDKAPLGVTELARKLGCEKASISRTIRGMTENALLERRQDSQDGRASTFCLTPQGTSLLAQIEENANRFIDQALELASERECRDFSRAIQGLNSALKNARSQREQEIVITEIAPDDNGAMAEIIRQSFRDNKVDHLEGVSLHDPELNNLYQTYQQPGSRYWVARANRRVLGGVGIAPLAGSAEKTCEMQKLFLSANALGTGLGRRLIALSLQEARRLGYDYCYLETLSELQSAVQLYEKFGFEYLETPQGNTGHGGCDLFMQLKLT
ncbi:bifunctional helix-turn-helix transcriptional regulator/GNAT family N-acetyltransferase [Jejubacter calystegiae]|uniref:Bifunctional helix-turn-helix transcriptional regulator/GNAT family N-acetyltransferase n=2 Tax=Jejubacter calystegiae TaxID=2579935 RepID=A0A4P8YEE8_9ENTR|nr:bifunctional helix-turn-helix transcriptional regulator/GNAT family N-acetyltransferase [Jejubacter calystegiae]